MNPARPQLGISFFLWGDIKRISADIHCFALLCFSLPGLALLCIALHCFALLCIALLCFALQCFALLCIALHCFALFRCHMIRFLGFGGRREKVSHVTVFGVWGAVGKGATC